MQRIALCLSVLAVAACGPKPPPNSNTAIPIPDGPGCPSAESTMVVVYHAATATRPAGWSLPLANRRSEASEERYDVLDPTAAAGAGIPTPPARLWVLQVGAPPCEATSGAFFSHTVIDGPANDVLGVELTTTCPAPASEQAVQGIAVVAEASPTGCVVLLPRPVAGRVAEEGSDTWKVLPQSTPMPPAVEAALPTKTCVAPCEELWTVSQVDLSGSPLAWDAAVEWLHVDPAQPDPCQWASEGDGGVLVANADGSAARVDVPGASTQLHLAGALADRGGPKVLVLEHIGEYATLDLRAGAPPRLGRHLRWYLPNEELYAGDRKLGPYCGP
ncbi:MAG: hypothetical protein R3B48_10620 [Kofleriaceae bacterium]